jgi:hypothetical protein
MQKPTDGVASKKDAKAACRFGSERGVDYDDIVRPVSDIRPPPLSSADNTDDTLGDDHGPNSTETVSSERIEKVPCRPRDRRRGEDQLEDSRRRREDQDDEEQPWKPSARQTRANKMHESDDESNDECDDEEAAPGAVSVPGIRSRQVASPAELLDDTIMVVDQGQQAYRRTSSNEDVVVVPIEATLATESAEIEQLQAEKEALHHQPEQQQQNRPPTFVNETILEAEIINPNAVDSHSKRLTSPMPLGLSGMYWALIALLGVVQWP